MGTSRDNFPSHQQEFSIREILARISFFLSRSTLRMYFPYLVLVSKHETDWKIFSGVRIRAGAFWSYFICFQKWFLLTTCGAPGIDKFCVNTYLDVSIFKSFFAPEINFVEDLKYILFLLTSFHRMKIYLSPFEPTQTCWKSYTSE